MIRDRDKQLYTGATLDHRHEAENALRDYIQGKYQAQYPIVAGRIRRLPNRMEGLIYFLTCDAENFPIKIGFGHIRLQREWFRREPELLEYIEKVAATETREQTGAIVSKRDDKCQVIQLHQS